MNKKSFINEKRVWTFAVSFSLALNILIIVLVSLYWLATRYVPPPEEEIVVIQLMEIPSLVAPVSPVAEEAVDIAELTPIEEVRAENILEIPQVETEISTKVEQQAEQVEIPKPPLDLPTAEMVVEQASPAGTKLSTAGERIDLPEDLSWQGVEAEATIRARVEEVGASTRLAQLAREGAQRIESTVGETLATGEIVPPPPQAEKRSPFTKRPIAIVMENAPQARPQSGLSQADIVYEIATEGGITRFLAIFASEVPERVGPVRSARPYFVMKAAENDAIFAHVGGSVEAYTMIREMRVNAIDEFKFFQAFWRTRDRQPPYNLYTSIATLRNQAQSLGYNRPIRSVAFPLRTPEEDLGTPQARRLEIGFTGDYQVRFVYDPIQNIYRRYINGLPHIDAANGRQITCSTIIVQITEQVVKDAEGRLEIRFVGRGDGWAFLDGKAVRLTWEKRDLRDKTQFFLPDGRELKINPGKLWIQVVNTNTPVNFH
ncbi:MAG TPA: DUF3048 domain-containing protein [Atribacteraceae bacterium]|nr:DUF3048 domain-containing protein [Atribacteraceae bacterium]